MLKTPRLSPHKQCGTFEPDESMPRPSFVESSDSSRVQPLCEKLCRDGGLCPRLLLQHLPHEKVERLLVRARFADGLGPRRDHLVNDGSYGSLLDHRRSLLSSN